MLVARRCGGKKMCTRFNGAEIVQSHSLHTHPPHLVYNYGHLARAKCLPSLCLLDACISNFPDDRPRVPGARRLG